MTIGSSINPPVANVLARGSSELLSSSVGLGWESIAVQRHNVGAGEKPEAAAHRHPETSAPCHLVKLASGQQMSHGERKGRFGHFAPYSKPPGTMNLNVEGVVPAMNSTTQTELIVCAINTTFVREIAEEQESHEAPTLREQIGFRDEALAGLVRLIEVEAQSGGESGRLYIDHLAHALTLRMFSLGAHEHHRRILRATLPVPRLKRVIDRMEAGIGGGVDLQILAKESGYSRSHFLKMFRVATGFTPHQYLLHLRIKRAEAMMRNQSMPLIQIALKCGFASHAHLSRVFRGMRGISPSEYRRSTS